MEQTSREHGVCTRGRMSTTENGTSQAPSIFSGESQRHHSRPIKIPPPPRIRGRRNFCQWGHMSSNGDGRSQTLILLLPFTDDWTKCISAEGSCSDQPYQPRCNKPKRCENEIPTRRGEQAATVRPALFARSRAHRKPSKRTSPARTAAVQEREMNSSGAAVQGNGEHHFSSDT